MANENKKDFNAQLSNNKNMPKILELDEEASKKWKGKTMVVAPPIDYDNIIKTIPKGKLMTTNEIRIRIAKKYNTEITCPLTAGIFINIVAWASYQRDKDITPYWRVLKKDGELNSKYPENFNIQIKKLKEEGHEIITKGKNKDKYFVKDYEKSLIS